MDPLLGPLKPTGPMIEAHGPPKVHGPRGHCSPPRPPFVSPAYLCHTIIKNDELKKRQWLLLRYVTLHS